MINVAVFLFCLRIAHFAEIKCRVPSRRYPSFLCNRFCSNLAAPYSECLLEDNQECLELIEKVNFHVANFLKIMLWEVNNGLFGVPAKTTTSLMIQFIFNLSLHKILKITYSV
jgi:hypothetical protein